MENDIQYLARYGEMPMTNYDKLLTAEELSREMVKAANERKKKTRGSGKTGKAEKTVETGMLTKTARFLGNMKMF